MACMQRVLLTTVFCLAPALSEAGARNQIQDFVATVQAATGHFKQYTIDAQGKTRPAQSGTFSFQRPGRFKWAVKQPYEQLIVSDGREVFQYDPDLNQVTVRQVDQAIGASPAAILFGSGKLEDSFNVSEQADHDGLQWLLAEPRSADTGFTQVEIGLQENRPVRIILLDAFGQKTHVELSGVEPVADLHNEAFRFTPPTDTDVVRM